MKKLITLFFAFLGIMFFIFAFIEQDAYIMLIAIAFFILATIIYSIIRYEARFGYIILISTIFIFLLSRTYYRAISGLKLEQYFEDYEVYKSLLYTCISIISIFFCELIFASDRRIDRYQFINGEANRNDNEKNVSYLTICKGLFFVSAICKVIVLFVKIFLVQSVGYSSSYLELTDTIAGIPTIITKLSDFYLVAFIVILSISSRYKDLKPYIAIFISISILGLFTGARSNFFVPIVFLIWFISYYRYMNPNEFEFPKLARLLSLRFFVLIYMATVLIGVLGQIRVNGTIDATVFNPFKTLSDNLGGSNLVLLRTFYIEDGISDANRQSFIFGPFLNFINNNVISKLLFNTDTPAYGTVDYAINGRNFGSYLTYKYDQTFYFAGGGFGSSYVAEAYMFAGVLGVILVSVLYSYFLSLSYQIKRNSWILRTLYFLMIYWIFYAPRDAALYFLTAGLNITNLFFIGLMIIAGKLLNSRSYRKKEPN